MPRKKGTPNKKPKIVYPRLCEHCGYAANNPAMYFYHRQTHDVIDGTLCYQGCGQLATHRNTRGAHTCTKISQQCPAYIEKHSERVKEQWVDADDRKERTREIFVEVANTDAAISKRKASWKKKREAYGLLTPEDDINFRRYAREIRGRAQSWAKEQGYVLGPQTFHVDHRFSIMDSWKAGLSVDEVNHPFNLEVIPAAENSSKGANSSITLEQLLEHFPSLDSSEP